MSQKISNGTTFYDDFLYLTHKNDVNNDEIIECYDHHAGNYEDTVKVGGFIFAAKYFAKHAAIHKLDKSATILDVGCGSGRVGKELASKYGFTSMHIDGVDPSCNMLEMAKSINIYRNLTLAKLGNGSKLDMEDNIYDAAVVGTAVCPGHMPLDGFLEIMRVVKPGGLIVNAMREEWARTSPECDVNTVFTKWQIEGRWTLMEWAWEEKVMYPDKDLLVQVYQVLGK